MANVVKVVLQLLDCILVALAVGIIYLRPSRDSRFNQVAEMIERDRSLITFGALAPFRARPNQADVSFQRIPKLRQLVESKFAQPTPHRCDTNIPFSCVDVFIRLMGAAAHCSKFEKNESSSIAADPFLPEKDWTTLLCPNEERNEHEERSAND